MKELANLMKRKKSGAGVEESVKWKYFKALNFLAFTFEKGCRRTNLKVTFCVIVILSNCCCCSCST